MKEQNNFEALLSSLSGSELKQAIEMLSLLFDKNSPYGGCPQGFSMEGISVFVHPDSGRIFLSNKDDQLISKYGNKLEMWHTLPYSGDFGTLDDLLHNYNSYIDEDKKFIDNIKTV